MFLQTSLHVLPFSLIFSFSLIQAHSVALSGCQDRRNDTGLPLFTSLLGMLVLPPVLVGTWIVWTLQKTKMESHRRQLFDRNGGNLLKKKLFKKKRLCQQMRIYTAEEIKNATNDYSDRKVLEKCTPGTFYRGCLDDEKPVVVMKIPAVPLFRVEEFVDQMIFLSQPHVNLVRIMGCCLETSCPLLVYELHGDGNRTLFDCIRDREESVLCVKAAAGAAGGLAYLHSNMMFHGNICSGNILVDDHFDAKLFYAVEGDWDSNGVIASSKSDVYSFGAVLDELLTRGIESEVDEDVVMWREEEEGETLKKVAVMAARCLSVRLEERPSVKELAASLTASLALN